MGFTVNNTGFGHKSIHWLGELIAITHVTCENRYPFCPRSHPKMKKIHSPAFHSSQPNDHRLNRFMNVCLDIAYDYISNHHRYTHRTTALPSSKPHEKKRISQARNNTRLAVNRPRNIETRRPTAGRGGADAGWRIVLAVVVGVCWFRWMFGGCLVDVC